MEHPHNAVLLQCTSFEKGCRPFMCNTSYRHSNCLDQFCKSSASSPSTTVLQEIPSGNMTSASRRQRELSALYDQTEAGTDSRPKLSCPLCRGEIYGWSVVQAAREFMNSKARSCSSDTCDFIGTYSELRKHARSDHPLARPTEVDPERQRDWTRFEQDRDYEDILSSMQTIIGEESNGERMSALELHSWFTLNLAYLALALEVINDARDIEQVQFRRRSGNRRFRYDQESDRGTRENSSFIPDRAFFSRRNNPSPVERFQGRQPSSQSRLHWRHSRPPSERVFQGRRQSSQADTTHRSQGLRWRTPRWSSTFNNGQ
ncbi:hypothetical protein PTKIN_Ptkin13bG0132400 [Pterospermum kingtungense]